MLPTKQKILALAIASSLMVAAAGQNQTSDHNSRRIGLQVHEFENGIAPPARLVTLDGPPGFPFSLWLESPASRPFTSPFDTTYGYTIGGGGPPLVSSIDLMNSPLQVDPIMTPFVAGIIPASGRFTLTFPGVNPLPVDWRVMMQAFLFDPLSTPVLTNSNGVEKTVAFPRPRPDLTPWTNAVMDARFTAIPTGSRDVEQADVDGDGDLDILTIPCGGMPSLCRKVGGIYQAPVPIMAPGATSAEFVDLDNDGMLDLIFATNSVPLVFVNRGFSPTGINVLSPISGSDLWLGYQQVPGPLTLNPALPATFPSEDIETADVNGDGLLDFLVAVPGSLANGAVNRLFLNVTQAAGATIAFFDITLSGGPGGIGLFQGAPVMDNTDDVEFADLDSDGDMDIVVANFDGPVPITGIDFFYVNQGLMQGGVMGSYLGPFTFPGAINDESLDVCLGDLNRDGFPDVYIGNWYQTAGNTPPFFAPSLPDQLYVSAGVVGGMPTYVSGTAALPLIPFNKATVDVEMTDYDLDGDLDIFLAQGVRCLFPNGILPGQLATGLIALQNNLVAPLPPGMIPPPFTILPPLPGTAGLLIDELEFGDLQTLWWDRDLMMGTTTGFVPLLR